MRAIYFLVHQNRLDDQRLMSAAAEIPEDWNVHIVRTPPVEKLSELFSNWAQGKNDRIIVCGGDGSLHQAAEIMLQMPQEQRLPLGVLPLGTANDFAKAIGVTDEELQNIVKQTIEAEVSWIDVGLVNEKPFINAVSIGSATKNTTEISGVSKNLFGRFSYYLNAISRIADLKPFSYEIQGEGIEPEAKAGEALAILVGNGSMAGGGLKFAPDAQIDDGLLDTLVVKPQDLASLARLAAELLNESPNLQGREVHRFQAKKFSLKCAEPQRANLDGEPMEAQQFNFKTLARQLPVALLRSFLVDLNSDEFRN